MRSLLCAFASCLLCLHVHHASVALPLRFLCVLAFVKAYCLSNSFREYKRLTVTDDAATASSTSLLVSLLLSGDDACRDDNVGMSLNGASSAEVRSQLNVHRESAVVACIERAAVESLQYPA